MDGIWPLASQSFPSGGAAGDQLLTRVKTSMKYKLDVEVRGHTFTCIMEREQQGGLKTPVIVFSFHFLIVFLCMLINIVKTDLITLIGKEKNFYDSNMSLEACSFLLFSFPPGFIALS